ncbi:MAG TPA: toll/interleukin-1 receptor domain-containing protein [Candidatus Kapabacteria bacterium]|nr:toll/interleukin-1 receptor domain-containing protein [Candidatus Kapabacteria bacterium]
MIIQETNEIQSTHTNKSNSIDNFKDSKSGNNKIFISHSSRDVNYIKLFVDKILKLGLEIPADRIFCSSVAGHGIKSGKYIPDTIREEILSSSLVLLMISHNYKKSEICLNELGAAWISNPKEKVLPLLLHNVDFNDLGILDSNRLSLKINDKNDIIQFIEDCKNELNPSFNLQRVTTHIDEFISEYTNLDEEAQENNEDSEYIILGEEAQENKHDQEEWHDCFAKSLRPFSDLLSRAFPTYYDGIYQINDESQQKKLLLEFSKFELSTKFWFKFSGGDYYIEKIQHLPSGNWLIMKENWEIKISDMWISKNSESHNDFILVKSDALEPFEVQSDARGKSYKVGIMKEGITISDAEVMNGYALINGETVKLTDDNYEPRHRLDKSHWIFFASIYHKIGCNTDEVFDFCKLIDSSEIILNEKNLSRFLKKLSLHPVVSKYK